MKKIFFAITAGAVLVLSACNNEEANNKLKEADAAAVQAAVDAKLAELQTSIDATCQATADSIATAQFDQWVAENSKGGKKPVASKPKPKPTEPKKEEPKKQEPTGGIKGKSDENSGGLKGKSDQKQQTGGGLRGKRDGQ